MATKTLRSRSAIKPTVKKRTLNWIGAQKSSGAPFSEQDPKRRLGSFTAAGAHSRIGGRTSRIVGQTTKKVHTDKRK